MEDLEFLLTYWYGIPTMPNERLKKIKQAGFKSLSLHWCDEYEEANGKKEKIMEECNDNSFKIKMFHLPFEKADKLWQNNVDGDQLFEIYQKCIFNASVNNIKYVVMHLNYNANSIVDENIGITRLNKLLNYGNKIGVNIAFENLADKDNLEVIEPLIRQYSNACLCFDVGHNNINPSEVIMRNKDKIGVIHIHDNFGEKDTHQIPFTGNVDWSYVYTIMEEVMEHCEFVFEIQNHDNLDEEKFLNDAFIAYQEIKNNLRKRVRK